MILASCSLVEKKTIDLSRATSGRWTSSAKVLVSKTGKSQSFDITFRAIKDKRTRLDISALMGTPVASVVLDGSKIEAIIIRQKKIYEGRPTAEVLKEALGIGFDPALVQTVLFESIPTGENWDCKEDGNKSKRCVGPKEDIIVNWQNRGDQKRIVEVETIDFKLILNFNDFSP